MTNWLPDRETTVGDIVRVRTSHASTILAVVIAEEVDGPDRPGRWLGFAANGFSQWLQETAIVDRSPLCRVCGQRGRWLRNSEAVVTCAVCGPRLNWSDAWHIVTAHVEHLQRDRSKGAFIRDAIARCDASFARGDAPSFQKVATELQWIAQVAR